MAMLTIKERVANGARWLDENFPGWEDRIDIDTLKLYSGHDCICGQLFARTPSGRKRAGSGYGWALKNLFTEANSWIPVPKDQPRRALPVAYTLGFASSKQETDTAASYTGLQKEWTRLLKERQAVHSSDNPF